MRTVGIPFEWKLPAGRKRFDTIGSRLHWSYANLAMAHAAIKTGATKYRPFPHFQIRAKFYKGLNDGTMKVGSLFADERLKMLGGKACVYCGLETAGSIDHLIPRFRGGNDAGENLVASCLSCNASKGAKDVMVWHRQNNRFPSLSIVRRYLKIAMNGTVAQGLMGMVTADLAAGQVNFAVEAIPLVFPPPAELTWDIVEHGPTEHRT